MKKKFAPIAFVFGILSTLLLGSTASANATADLFVCTQAGVVVTCANGPITVTINLPVQIPVDVDALENVLSNINILSIGSIETTIANFLNPVIAPTTLSGNNITVCFPMAVCG
ncbi:MAG: hypothetical protein ACRDTG_16365 [Pseudonocardiaceae bacterium]